MKPKSLKYKHIDYIQAHYNKNINQCEYFNTFQTNNYDKYLVDGVEDGWIKVDKKTWEKYLKVKKRLNI